MFINLSNHPSDAWTQEQKDAASQYGEIQDLPFPNIPPEMGEKEVADLAGEYALKVQHMLEAVHDGRAYFRVRPGHQTSASWTLCVDVHHPP
jgi:hypothetical protein